MLKRSLGLRGQAVFALVAVGALATLALVSAVSMLSERSLRDSAQMRATSVATLSARTPNVRAALAGGEPAWATSELTLLVASDPSLQYALLLDSHNDLVAMAGPDVDTPEAGQQAIARHLVMENKPFEDRPLILASAQVLDDTSAAALTPRGKLLIGMRETTSAALKGSIAGAGILMALVLAAAAFIVLTRMLRRLQPLLAFTHRLSKGDLSNRLHEGGGDELDELSRALNDVATGLGLLIGRVAGVARSLGDAVDGLRAAADHNLAGSELETSGLNRAAVSLNVMGRSLKDMGTAVVGLAKSASESAQGAETVGLQNGAVGDAVEGLAGVAEQTARGAAQVGRSVSSVAKEIEVLSSAAEQAASAMSRLDQAVQRAKEMADESATQAGEVASEASKGYESVTLAIRQIEEISSSTEHAMEALRALSGQIASVGAFLDAIGDVARRTNLLALNAAIIAASAGEHGRSFSVVADEVKALAGQTSELTKDIERVINGVIQEGDRTQAAAADVRSRVDAGVQKAHEAIAALERILAQSTKGAEMGHGIADNMSARAGDFAQVSHAVQKVAHATQEISRATQAQVRDTQGLQDNSRHLETLTQDVRRAQREQADGTLRITRSLGDVHHRVQRLTESQAEQQSGGSQIQEVVEQLRGVSDEGRRRAQDLEQLLETLEAQASELREELLRFNLGTRSLGPLN